MAERKVERWHHYRERHLDQWLKTDGKCANNIEGFRAGYDAGRLSETRMVESLSRENERLAESKGLRFTLEDLMSPAARKVQEVLDEALQKIVVDLLRHRAEMPDIPGYRIVELPVAKLVPMEPNFSDDKLTVRYGWKYEKIEEGEGK